MRSAGTFGTEAQARLFADYLLTEGIESQVSRESGGWTVWVLNEEYLECARAEREAFLENPDAQRFRAAERGAEAVRKRRAEQERSRAPVVNLRERWAARPRRRDTPITIGLIIASILVTIYARGGQNESVMEALLFHWPTIVRGRQWWRVITPIFLHFGVIHLLFNMLWLHYLGRLIEQRRGKALMAGLVLLSGVAGNAAQYLATGPYSGGMSGVVYALFGYVWMNSYYDPFGDIHIEKSTVVIMLGWFFLAMTGMFGPIGNWAHGAGLLTGMAVALAGIKLRKLRR